MKVECKNRKAKAGLLLIASPRFKNLSGPKRGTYGERKDAVVKDIKATMNFVMVTILPQISPCDSNLVRETRRNPYEMSEFQHFVRKAAHIPYK